MDTSHHKKIKRFEFLAARSVFRSLFMEGWQEAYLTWQEAITVGSLDWAFTPEKFRDAAADIDQLLSYPEPVVKSWLICSCSGLPKGSPDPAVTNVEFLGLVRDLISHLAADWEAQGKPRRKDQ